MRGMLLLLLLPALPCRLLSPLGSPFPHMFSKTKQNKTKDADGPPHSGRRAAPAAGPGGGAARPQRRLVHPAGVLAPAGPPLPPPAHRAGPARRGRQQGAYVRDMKGCFRAPNQSQRHVQPQTPSDSCGVVPSGPQSNQINRPLTSPLVHPSIHVYGSDHVRSDAGGGRGHRAGVPRLDPPRPHPGISAPAVSSSCCLLTACGRHPPFTAHGGPPAHHPTHHPPLPRHHACRR